MIESQILRNVTTVIQRDLVHCCRTRLKFKFKNCPRWAFSVRYICQKIIIQVYLIIINHLFKLMQHEQMAAHYVETMAEILAEFDSNKYEFSYYELLAWSGSLQNTVAYNEKSETEKTEIMDTYLIEYLNGYKLCIGN